jgi:predicted MFS family arabinose efflux permease
MGVISMAYFCAFVIGVPVAAFIAARQGWQVVFGILAGAGALAFAAALILPSQSGQSRASFSAHHLAQHFHKPDRLAGIVAAFLTSGGIVGFLTYIGAWLRAEHGMDIERIGLLFMVSGIAAVAASPVSGAVADRTGRKSVIVWANVALAVLFVVVGRMQSGAWLVAGIAALSIAASARQAPLHALTTEIVGGEIRGEYIAVRNAASQVGIAAMAAASAYAFDAGGFVWVSALAAAATVFIPVACLWIPEPIEAKK